MRRRASAAANDVSVQISSLAATPRRSLGANGRAAAAGEGIDVGTIQSLASEDRVGRGP
jgi:hypothetical protein